MALVNLVSPQCGCDFTTSQLTDRVFLCDPSSPNAVTYQAQLHGTRHANVSQLASIIQGLSQETTASIPVQFSLLTIQSFCIVSSTSLSPCSQNDEKNGALPVNIIVLVVIVIIVIIIIMVMVGIIIAFSIKTSRNSKSAK